MKEKKIVFLLLFVHTRFSGSIFLMFSIETTKIVHINYKILTYYNVFFEETSKKL